jgi:hypothetical protein
MHQKGTSISYARDNTYLCSLPYLVQVLVGLWEAGRGSLCGFGADGLQVLAKKFLVDLLR